MKRTEKKYKSGIPDILLAVLFLAGFLWLRQFVFMTSFEERSILPQNIFQKFALDYMYPVGIFYLITVLMFPHSVEEYFCKLESSDLPGKVWLQGAAGMIIHMVTGLMLLSKESAAWLAAFGFFSVLALAAASCLYVRKQSDDQKRKAAAVVLLYLMMWAVLLYIRGSGKSFCQFVYGESCNFDSYAPQVRALMKNASMFGTSGRLLEMQSIHRFLYGSYNYIHQLLFYGGWAAVTGYLVFLAGYLVVLGRMLGTFCRRVSRLQIVYIMAFVMAALRTVIGILYSFALLPVPVPLPFSSGEWMMPDLLGLILLLKCSWENHKIKKIQAVEFASPDRLFGKTEAYVLVKTKSRQSDAEGSSENENDQPPHKAGGSLDRVLEALMAGDERSVCLQRKEEADETADTRMKRLVCVPEDFSDWWETPEENADGDTDEDADNDTYVLLFPIGQRSLGFVLREEEDGTWRPADEEAQAALLRAYKYIHLSEYVEVDYERIF